MSNEMYDKLSKLQKQRLDSLKKRVESSMDEDGELVKKIRPYIKQIFPDDPEEVITKMEEIVIDWEKKHPQKKSQEDVHSVSDW